MKRFATIIASTLCATFAHAQEMQPGLWEITTTMTMQGMQMPGGTFKHCYTAKDIAAGKQYNADDKSKCTIANLKTGGGKVSYDMACTIEGGKMNASVKGTLSGTAYAFDQKMRMTPDHGMGEMNSTIQGRRIGDCK